VDEHYGIMKKESKDRRATNREKSSNLLKKYDVNFNSCNGGSHLVITDKTRSIDFWPGTGKWVVRKGISGRGFFRLLKIMGVSLHPEDISRKAGDNK